MSEKKVNILVVDDEEMIRSTISDFLEDYGFRVGTARDGEEGIAKFKEGSYDAVILDLNMPVRNGFEVLDYLHGNYPAIPVIVVSGTGVIRDVVEAQRRGAWDYITKPIYDMELLIQVINKCMGNATLMVQNIEYKLYLEEKVDKRTLELEEMNEKLRGEILRSRENEDRIRSTNMELNTMLEEIEAMNEELLSSKKDLELSEKKYRLLADNVTDNIWILDINSLKLTYISPSIEKISGYTVEEMTGESLEKILKPDSYEKIITILKIQTTEDDKKASISPVTVELQMNRKDGTGIWIEITASFLRDAERKITGILGISRDITERKQAEEEVKSSLSEKETLLKEIHHRVKNNMQVISSILSLQANYIDNERDRDLLIDCQRRVHSMALIHEKLYQSNKLSAINFSEYVNGLANELLSAYAAASRSISIRIEIKNLFLGVDFAIPCALLLNELISNSLKYAFPGMKSGEIFISFARKDSLYFLRFSDNGIGIPEEIDFKKPVTMGLELINLITQQLNGEFTLERSNGTSYFFDFDFDNKKSHAGSYKAVTGRVPGRNKKILIVEDDLITATLIKKIIETQNISVVGIADSADSALEILEHITPDLILMDIILKGGMDGIDTVKKIKLLYNIPVIYSTANTDPLIKKRAGETGPTGYITKPINKTELLHLIKQSL